MFNPSDYDVSEQWGFLPNPIQKPNLQRLPLAFEPWELLLDKAVGLNNFRDEAEKLPLLSTDDLTDESHWRRAYVVLTMLATTYIWMGKETNVKQSLPKQLAVPWVKASEKVGVRPIVTYSAVVLFNFNVISTTGDPKQDLEDKKIEIVHTFTDTDDEKWFYMGSLLVEIEAISGLRMFPRAFQAIANGDNQSLSTCLDEIRDSLQNMVKALQRTKERKSDGSHKCKPEVFYNQVRISFNGTKSKHFSHGLEYEGVEEQPGAYGGASAGQSSVMAAFDEFFGIRYDDQPKVKEFFDQQRWHMPGKHREYLQKVSEKSFVRKYVQELKNNELLRKYNSCIRELINFRNIHYKLVRKYIITEAEKVSSQKKGNVDAAGGSEEPQMDLHMGMGGTPLETFLDAVIQQTREHLL